MSSTTPASQPPRAIAGAEISVDKDQINPPPCSYWKVCATRAIVEKVGRSVCYRCAARLRGAEYPLRPPCPGPIYLTSHVAAESLDMVESAAGSAVSSDGDSTETDDSTATEEK